MTREASLLLALSIAAPYSAFTVADATAHVAVKDPSHPHDMPDCSFRFSPRLRASVVNVCFSCGPKIAGLTTSLLQVVPRAQSLFSRSVAFSLSAHEIFGRTWGREAQNTILHAAPASNGRICSARSHGCQVRVRRSFRHLSIGSGRLHRIWPFAPPREGILFQPPIELKEARPHRIQIVSGHDSCFLRVSFVPAG